MLKDPYELIEQQQQNHNGRPTCSLSVILPLRNNPNEKKSVYLMIYNNMKNHKYEKYFSLPTASRQVDPFIWWNDRKDEFPIMSILAKNICVLTQLRMSIL